MSLNLTTVREILKDYSEEKGNLMVVLHEVQKACGNYLPADALREVSIVTGIPMNRIYGFVSFYTMFSTEKRGKNLVRVCKDGPCAVNGAYDTLELLMKELDIEVGETTSDGLFTLEETACLGTCTAAPAIMINDQIHADVTPESLGGILKQYK